MSLFKKQIEKPAQNEPRKPLSGRIIIDVNQQGDSRNINVDIQNLPLDTAYVALDVAKNSIVRGGPNHIRVPVKEDKDLSYVG